MNNELTHHGILGQKWGIRRFQNKDGTRTALGKKREQKNGKSSTVKKSSFKQSAEQSVEKKSLTNDELREKISRLELEKSYKTLYKEVYGENKKSTRGRDFVMDVLEKSGKNIATQLATYAMGALINKMAKSEIVNPKKGQKDK